ncbi:15-hydroxyprostaglandin dehydrogenase [NAD(+)]-like [Crassostrea angulata]|uniref:15-hydroxyprostaglandin dehydrogenase [NAD(+)]-like n=1 Tax=Magallana angulata TaxID=2784310 RepID=UPI0022B10E1D|nr:15-hydroxyprostaglandin dehydrogenase [NAD(+)]-like [Crassostrea angulata]
MFTGKAALITGAAQGLGKSFAAVLLQKGCKVCAVDINEEKLQSTVKEFNTVYGEGSVIGNKCDVTNARELKESFKQAKDTFRHIDIVVNNAGVVDEQNWEKCLDINLTAVIRGTLLALDYMRKDRGGNGGTIVNVSSMAGIYPVEFAPAYAASKHGVIGYTRSWAFHPEVQSNGVRLVCLCPAYTDTDIIKSLPKSSVDIELYQKSLQTLGVMKMERVMEAFVKLLEDTDNIGSVLSVNKFGIKYWKMPDAKL